MKRIAVIGAGISGMSSALKLVEAGYDATVFAKAFSPNITSNKAAAFWLPYHIRNDKRGVDWCRKSYEYYKQLASDPATGISMKKLIKLVADDVADVDRAWKYFMPLDCYKPIAKEALPHGYAEGDEAIVPLIETQIFLPWLRNILESRGVQFIEKNIHSFDEVNDYSVIINCTGLGARDLCNDEELIPYRGQVALLEPKDDLPIFLDNEKPQYIVPRKDTIIIGGTYEKGVYEEVTDPDTIAFLLSKAYKIYPELQQQKVIGSWAGLRPYRENPRVELELGTNIIHNYGHGGSGFTLAFGCAEDVVKLVDSYSSC